MAFIIKDRVKVNTTTTGTGDITLGSAVATFDTFQSYMSNGDTTYYAIVTKVSNTDEWEVGIGTWNTGNTLTRTTVLAGSNGTSAVNFTAGDKDVFMTYPASKAVYTDASGNIDINGGTIDGATVGATSASTGKFTTLQTTSNADIGGYIDLEVLSDHAAYQEGRVWYDSLHKTLNFYSDVNNVVHELGIEEHQRVYNNTGSTISKGAPLYFSGNYTAGTIDVPTIGLADATDVNAYNAQGLAAADIADGSYGYCIIAGQLTNVDTSGLTAGTNFFVGLTPGAVQNASPTYPNYPMCLGWVVSSDATDGVLLVNQQNHSVNSFRVRTDAHIGGDFQVDGDLTVLGTTTSVSTSDVTAGAPFYRANEGDAIGEAGTTFSGSGLDDAFFSGHFTGTTSTTYYVKIDGTGTPDTFSVSTDNFATTISTGNAITGSPQLIHSADNIYVEFGATTGHTLNDVWTGTASPINVDTGFFSNRNTGTSGVGYTHVGFYFDVSEGKWVLLDEYDPTPSGSINLADSSVAYATLKAGTFEGDLTGDVTGDVTGNASTADSLSTSRNIGGVAFNGTADINLPGVNTSGNQDTSGNAATATALATARTIQLSGDVTGSASFDGSDNVTITAAVQDDSHAHVISNVDGLQAALDDKADDTTTITAGSGLTGGGDLSANRTLNVGAGSGITVGADTVSHADTSSQASVNNSGRTYIQDITLDGFGHVTGLTSATETVTDTNQLTTFVVEDGDGTEVTISHGKEWKFVEGGGIDINWTDTSTGSDGDPYDLTIKHVDTSNQASVDNSNGTVIQDVTLDTYGHVTGLGSLDGDARWVNVTGDTMTGALTLQRTLGDITHLTLKQQNTSGDISSQKAFIDFTFVDANANGTPQVRIGANVGEDGGDANTQLLEGSGEFVVYTATGTTDSANSLTEKFRVSHDGKLFAGSNRVFADNYHPNADKWTTARTLTLSGDASGSVSWDGSANATLSVTVANDSHTHSNYVLKAGDTMTGRLYIDSTSNDKLILRGSNDPSMELQNASDQFRGRIGISNTGKEIRVVGQDPDNTNAIHVLGIGQNGLRYSTNNGGTFYKVWHANNDGSGSGLDADTLDGSHASSFASASHTHSNYITSNANDTGTGSYSTTGTYWEVKGDGGSVAMTTNDGYGNANLTFNHRSGTPDKTGSACRIETAVDNSTGKIDFEVGNNVTSGTAVSLTTVMSLTTGGATILGNTAWHAGNDGSGSGLDADTVDGVHESTFMRKSANSNLDMNNYSITEVNHIQINDPGPSEGLQWLQGSGWKIVECPDNMITNSAGNLQFATGDTRLMTLNTSGDLETTGGANFGRGTLTANGQNDVFLFGTSPTSGTAQSGAFHNKLRILGGSSQTRDLQLWQEPSGYAHIGSSYSSNALYIDSSFIWTTFENPIYVNTATDEKIILRGSSNPYIRFEEGSTDRAYIQWVATQNALTFRNQETDNFDFMPDASTGAVNLRLRGSDGDTWGSVYADDNSNTGRVGFLDDDQNWAYRITSDSTHEWLINNTVDMSLSSTALDVKGNNITEVDNIYLKRVVYHDDDTNTYFGFPAADQFVIHRGGTQRFLIDTDIEMFGNVITDTNSYMKAGYFWADSDINLKDNLVKVDSALDKVSKINGYTYNFKETPDKRVAGLIAQEVEKVLPEAVNDTKEGTKALDYNATIAVLVEAIKEQQVQIDELKEKLGM